MLNSAFEQTNLKLTCVPLVVDFGFLLNMMIFVGMSPMIHFAFMLDAMNLVLSFLRGNVWAWCTFRAWRPLSLGRGHVYSSQELLRTQVGGVSCVDLVHI